MINIPTLSDEQYLAAKEIEHQWLQEKVKLTPREELEVFSTDKNLLRQKIAEWSEQEKEYKNKLRLYLKKIQATHLTETEYILLREAAKQFLGKKILEAQHHTSRLCYQLSFFRGNYQPSDFANRLERARQVSVELLLSPYTQLKKRGRVMIGLCPFHTERSPSFTVYPEENRAWCFGCNRGGDVLAITQLLLDCDFKEAVSHLANL